MSDQTPGQPAFLAGGVRLPDPRLVEPLSVFRDAEGQVWQATPTAAGTEWRLLVLVSDQVHEVGVQRVQRWSRYVWIMLAVTAAATVAALYLPLRPEFFGPAGVMVLPFVRLLIVALPFAVTLVVLRRRRRYARVVDDEITPTTIALPTGARR